MFGGGEIIPKGSSLRRTPEGARPQKEPGATNYCHDPFDPLVAYIHDCIVYCSATQEVVVQRPGCGAQDLCVSSPRCKMIQQCSAQFWS